MRSSQRLYSIIRTVLFFFWAAAPLAPTDAFVTSCRSAFRKRDANLPGKRTHTSSARRSTELPASLPLELVPEAPSAASFHLLSAMLSSSSQLLSSLADGGGLFAMDKDTAEALAGPFFGLSLFPYLAFLYFLNVPENECPKGVVVGFATCLLFVFLTIPAAIAAKILYGVSLADCDWLHGSAESLLTVTNLATVIPFRQALEAKEKSAASMPVSATSYAPMVWLVAALTVFSTATVIVPALSGPSVHTPYLNGFLDLPFQVGPHEEPENALTVATWIIHVSSLVEFLVAMGFAWRWADVVQNPRFKGLTWGLLPLHSSGITACVSHVFYNQIAFLVPLQALLTCLGNATAAYAAFRIARSNGWKPSFQLPAKLELMVDLPPSPTTEPVEVKASSSVLPKEASSSPSPRLSSQMVGFEDLGDALAGDNDYTFLLKLFAGSAVFSYVIKYGATFFDFPFQANAWVALALIFVPSALNAYKWNRRSKDPSFEGWF